MVKERQKVLSLAELAAKLPTLIDKLAAAEKSIIDQMGGLKKQGLIFANPHWRDKKYLYLLYPSQSGQQRRREYVGTDPAKIEEAEESMRRAKDYATLERELQALQKVASEGRLRVQSAIAALSSR